MIGEATIRQVRERADIQAVVSETVKLARRGRSWVGLCPFHRERSPSFHVTPERGFYHCFGCGEHGSVIDFVMKTEGLSFPEAVRRLAERAGVEIEETHTDAQRKEELAARKAKDDLYGANNLAAVFFEKMLLEHPHGKLARDELERRGLVAGGPTDAVATALQSFRVGYAPAEWAALSTYLRQQGVSPHAAEQAGLLLPRSSGGGYYDRFRNRLMFAVVDLQGRVVAFSGRVLPDPQTGLVDKETGKYINSPETPVYRKGETVFGLFQARQAIRQAEQAVVVEGNFDVVSLHARGLMNVVAPLGTAFTAEQATQLKRFAPQVVLLFDGDAAGRKAVKAAREPCRKAGLEVRAATLPNGVDPDELCRDKGPDAVAAVIRAARGLLEHLIGACLDESFATADAQEKANRAKEVVEIINEEEDPSIRAMAHKYADDVASKLMIRDDRVGMADAATFRTLARSVEASLSPRGRQARPSEPEHVRDRPTDEVVGALLDFPSLLGDPEVGEKLQYVEGDAVFVVAALREDGGAMEIEKILANLPGSFHSFALQRLAAPVHAEREMAKTQLMTNLTKLQSRALAREKEALSQEAARAETLGDTEASDALLREIQARAVQKRKLRAR